MTELGIVFLDLPVIESVTVKSAVLVIELVTAIFVLYGIELVIVFFVCCDRSWDSSCDSCKKERFCLPAAPLKVKY